MGTANVNKSTGEPARRTGAVVHQLGHVSRSEIVEAVMKGDFSKNQIADPYGNKSFMTGTTFSIIDMPMNPNTLLRIVAENSTLKQCIEAMVTNVVGHGTRLEFIGKEAKMKSTASVKEAEAIEALLDMPNDEYSMTELLRRVRWDLEAMGNGYTEVARDGAGRVSAAWHLPAQLVRMTEVDSTPVDVWIDLPRPTGTVRVKVQKFFRRYVQRKGAKTIFFKEWGDPRTIDPKTGLENTALSREDSATEIYHRSLYHAGYAYGLPRWFNNITAATGAREAELTNLDYFSANGIPAMAIVVSGGSLTEQSLLALETQFGMVRGRAAQNRVAVIEAYGDTEGASESGAIQSPKVDLKSMIDGRPKDGLFLEYDARQTDKLRSSFRLPPIFLGLSADYTKATAATSYDVAESQVFGPERVGDDDFINKVLFKGYGFKFWEVRSNPPRVTDHETSLVAIEKFEGAGAMTPNIAIGMANEMFDLEIEVISEPWGNFPFSVIKAMAAKGTIKGWEDVMDKVDPPADPNADPNADQNADPNAAPDPNQQAGGTPPDPNADPNAAAAKVAASVRLAFADLRKVLRDNADVLTERAALMEAGHVLD